jgi:arsenate reductase
MGRRHYCGPAGALRVGQPARPPVLREGGELLRELILCCMRLHSFPMSDFTIYHNPRCSKSRETLALLEAHGVQQRVIEYLKTPPTAAELEAIVAKLGMRPEQLVRKSEEIYESSYAGKTLTDAQWIDAMVSHPVLIERPIVLKGGSAILGRPPESVKQLFTK